MDYQMYDKIQADLGGVGDELQSELKKISSQSNADQQTKDLLNEFGKKICDTFNSLADIVSRLATATTK